MICHAVTPALYTSVDKHVALDLQMDGHRPCLSLLNGVTILLKHVLHASHSL